MLLVLGGAASTGIGILAQAFCGFILSFVGTVVFLWGLESRVDVAMKKGVGVANKEEYEAGEKFLAKVLLVVLLVAPWLAPWAIGAGVFLRIFWAVTIK